VDCAKRKSDWLVDARCLNEVTTHPCGLTPDMTCLMVPSLPDASSPWSTNQHRTFVLRVEHVVQCGRASVWVDIALVTWGSSCPRVVRLCFFSLNLPRGSDLKPSNVHAVSMITRMRPATLWRPALGERSTVLRRRM